MQSESSEPLYYKRVKHFNVPGHLHFLTFSCFKRQPLLSNDLWRGWLAESIRDGCQKHNVSLWAYVFMPEHVHLLLQPRNENYSVSQWLKSMKNSMSKRVINDLRRQKSELLNSLEVKTRSGEYRFWQPGPGYDKNIWSMEEAIAKARYCHWNPCKRELVSDPATWRWSSFRWLELGNRDGEPLQIDDWIG